MIHRIPIIPCPRCIGGQMFYDPYTHEYECIDCGCTYSPSKIVAPSLIQSSGIPQGSFPHYLTKNNDDSNWRG